VLRVADIDKHAENVIKASQMLVADFAAYTTVTLGSRPKYVSLSSDSTTLSVCFKDQQSNAIHLYDIQSFKALVLQPFLAFYVFRSGTDLLCVATHPVLVLLLLLVVLVGTNVCFELSVPVQVIAWKDSSPK